jgi:hypothetical protein
VPSGSAHDPREETAPRARGPSPLPSSAGSVRGGLPPLPRRRARDQPSDDAAEDQIDDRRQAPIDRELDLGLAVELEHVGERADQRLGRVVDVAIRTKREIISMKEPVALAPRTAMPERADVTAGSSAVPRASAGPRSSRLAGPRPRCLTADAISRLLLARRLRLVASRPSHLSYFPVDRPAKAYPTLRWRNGPSNPCAPR